jgi:predicted nucleotidyltransferase
MRLSNKQKEIIEKTAVAHFGNAVKVYLFGSRVHMEQKGGDIDLLFEVESDERISVKKKIAVLVDLKKGLGDQKIDVVIKTRNTVSSNFMQIIDKTKVPIC